MKRIAQAASWIALAGILVPPVLFFTDRITLDAVKFWMLAATVLWFVATPLWMEHKAT
jgi:hypothetical protein